MELQAAAAIQTEAADTGWKEVETTSSARSSCSPARFLNAITADEPVVLLIDEIDKTDQEFEAMLLEVLSDFQISVPELDVVEARAPARAAHLEQLARAHRRRQAARLYLWLDYPDVERELEIVHLHAPSWTSASRASWSR